MAEGNREEIKLTEEVIGAFLEGLQDKGRKEGSLQNYRQVLTGLQEYLSPGKSICSTTAAEWKAWLEEQGFSRRTINARISVLNSFLKYAGKREWQKTDFFEQADTIQPELTRTEYIRLLRTAKRLNKEREYLLIKVMGGAGIRIQELENVTVEAVREGTVKLESYNRKQYRKLSEGLQQELLAYAEREHIRSGPVFMAKDGRPMMRSTVWYCVSSVSRDAKVPGEKVNPRSLWRMYCSTREGIEASIRALLDRAYERMLEEEEEQLAADWED